MSRIRVLFLVLLTSCLVHLSASAQQSTRPQRDRRPVSTSTIPELRGDTTLIKQDTLALLDSAKNVPKSEIETEILYYAEDSIITDFTENKVYLYKKAWFEYGKMRLDADRIVIHGFCERRLRGGGTATSTYFGLGRRARAWRGDGAASARTHGARRLG